MNRLLTLFTSIVLASLLAPPAGAAPTSIASVPLLNISGTGTVKPNLMLLYDNSGSMTFNYTPDYVNNTGSCRARATIAGGIRGCKPGDPPFASADFNKQYYNPKVRYLPPVKADGSSYPNQNAAETSSWTSVTTDIYGVDRTDLLTRDANSTNLVAGFPDLRWCDGSDCGYNTNGYTFPNDARYTPEYFVSNPYYYAINVAEYCTDATLTNCKVTAVGAAAPSGYPEPAKVRFCSDRALTNCQAKFVGDFKYPRFSDPNRNPDWYGTITIKASPYTNSMSISSVQVVEPNGTFTLTNAAVTAANGTDTAAKQTALAAALATSIIAKTGLANQYTACLRTANGSVPACSKFGITLDANNIVAVVPISCPAGNSSKAVGPCTVVNDGSRGGRDLIVNSGTRVTALLQVSGTSNNSKTQVLSNLSYGGVSLFNNSTLSIGSRSSSATVATLIKNKIGTTKGITAYVGGTSANTAGPICAAASTSYVCLVSTSMDSVGDNIVLGSLTNNTSGRTTYLSFGATPGISDGVPTDVTPLGASVFVRTDIVSTRTSYPKDVKRTDCSGASCTYAEEMTNFANWYAYYKSRNQMMKTAVGQAFQPIADNYNVGIVSLSTAAAEGTIRQPPKPFTGAARTAWYKALYDMSTSGSTPVRQGLHAVGKMYANRSPYAYSAGNEVVQFPCQQNFTFVTTDGYWNGGAADGVVNNDNKEDLSRFCSKSKGCVDTSVQTANSLADVALYWYNGGSNDAVTSLRPSLENWNEPNGLVAAAAGDNTRLHMNTYALGLGVDGIMTYDDKYDTAPKVGSDFYKLITGVQTGCPWNNNGPYVWPNPQTQVDDGGAAYQSRVDDLWHAAINGHGKYFSASDPLQVIDGLRAALSNIEVKIGAAAAAATSTPNISQQDNDIFSATFTTVRWYGELSDKKINTVTGVVGSTASWNSSETVGRQVGTATDDRRILMRDFEGKDDTDDGLKDFDFGLMTDTEQAWFKDKCSALAQCLTLSDANRKLVNNGDNMVRWLRGQQQNANDTLFRAYSKTTTIPGGASAQLPIVLGDIASSKPAYLRDPRKSYPLDDYNAYKLDNTTRQPTVFVAANDGMLHAFNAETGVETWAYAPRITMKKLYLQASTTYGTNHQFTTDGSPEVADVKINGEWRSVLVAGLNGGGRGYYALDVTDPDAPKALWELCADTAVCSGSNYDKDIGLTFGNPQFGTWKDARGVEYWAVFLTSGYNNVPGTDGIASGDGRGYLYVVDIATGRVLSKKATPKIAGKTQDSQYVDTPTGFARITAITSNPNTDPKVTFVYGGDNDGAMWRYDFTAPGDPSVLLLGSAGSNQPVTTRPDVTTCLVNTVAQDGSQSSSTTRVVAFGTGRLLDEVDIASTGVQSAYVLKDAGSIPTADWRSTSKMAKQTLAKISGTSTSYSISGPAVDFSTQSGWYVDFALNTGERVNLDPKIVSGGLNVVTNLPSSSSSCKVGGTSNVYQLNVCTGEPLGETIKNSAGVDFQVAGRTLSNASAAVGFIIVRLPSGALKMITTTADGNTITSGVAPAESEGASRAGWRRVRE